MIGWQRYFCQSRNKENNFQIHVELQRPQRAKANLAKKEKKKKRKRKTKQNLIFPKDIKGSQWGKTVL